MRRHRGKIGANSLCSLVNSEWSPRETPGGSAAGSSARRSARATAQAGPAATKRRARRGSWLRTSERSPNASSTSAWRPDAMLDAIASVNLCVAAFLVSAVKGAPDEPAPLEPPPHSDRARGSSPAGATSFTRPR